MNLNAKNDINLNVMTTEKKNDNDGDSYHFFQS